MTEEKKLIEVKDLRVSFFTPAGEVKAVDGISYSLGYNEVMGVVGESGSGKSVEAYSIIGLLQNPGRVIGGSITFEGEDLLAYTPEQMRQFRGNKVSMIFQNPMTCLNPVYTIGNQLTEALTCHDKNISRAEAFRQGWRRISLFCSSRWTGFTWRPLRPWPCSTRWTRWIISACPPCSSPGGMWTLRWTPWKTGRFILPGSTASRIMR